MTAPPDDDARRWLAALAARVEDDPDLLDALSDAEADRLLAEADVRASGVAASIRRRVRKAEHGAPPESPGARRRQRPLAVWTGTTGVLGSLVSWWWNAPEAARKADRRWALAAAVVVVGVVGLSVWALRAGTETAVGEVLVHRAELVALAGPPTKGDGGSPLARGARGLLAAAEADPPDRVLALEAAETLARSAQAETDPEAVAVRAYYAGLAYRLAGDPAAADRWLRRVPEGTTYAARAADLL